MRSGKIRTNAGEGTARLFQVALFFGVMAIGCAPSTPRGTSPQDGQGRPVVSEQPPPILEQPQGPESYREGVAELVALRNTVRDAFAAKDSDKAHGPLHDVGRLLEGLPDLFAKISTVESDRATVRKVVDEMFEHFGKVDAKMHGDAGASYEDVSKQIDAALGKLQQLLPR